MPQPTAARHIQEVSNLIERRLGLKGATIQSQLAKLGRRRLPRTLRYDLDALAKAQLHLTHPKLSRQVSDPVVARHAGLATGALTQFDLQRERTTRVLRNLAKISAIGIALFIGIVWWMVKTGKV